MDIITKKQLNILIQLAEVDREFASEEKELILRIAEERGFPEESVDILMKNPEPIGTLGALSEEKRLDYLLSCISLVFADKKVRESEVIFCRGIAIKLGFKRNVVDYLIENHQKSDAEELRMHILKEFV